MSVERIYLVGLLASGYGIPEVKERFLTPASNVGKSIFTLETFYDRSTVLRLLDKLPDVKIFLDSGAFSLMCKAVKDQVVDKKVGKVVLRPEVLSRVPEYTKEGISQEELNRGMDFGGFLRRSISRYVIDFSIFDSKEFRNYLDSYVEFVHKYENQLQVYVNLDVIFNPKKTWENQKYLESCGLKPLPVFHYGEDLEWLKKYMDSYEYIGIGGVSQVTKQEFREKLGNPAFKLIFESDQKIRVHGFAVTSVDLLTCYDWASCDSSTWIKCGAYGDIFVPRYDWRKKQFNYLVSPNSIRVSGIPNKSGSGHFTFYLSEEEIKAVRKYLAEMNLDEEKLKISYGERHKANALYFQNLMKYLSEHKDKVKLRTIQRRVF